MQPSSDDKEYLASRAEYLASRAEYLSGDSSAGHAVGGLLMLQPSAPPPHHPMPPQPLHPLMHPAAVPHAPLPHQLPQAAAYPAPMQVMVAPPHRLPQMGAASTHMHPQMLPHPCAAPPAAWPSKRPVEMIQVRRLPPLPHTRPDPLRRLLTAPCPVLGGLAGCLPGPSHPGVTPSCPRHRNRNRSACTSPPRPPLLAPRPRLPLTWTLTSSLPPSPLPPPPPTPSLTLTLSLAGSGAGRARHAEEAHAQPDQPAAHLAHQRADQRPRRQSAAAARAKPRAPARD